MDRQPWERLDNETDTAYEAFSQYLELPKCGKSHDHGKPGGRRFKSDLARLRGIKTPTIEGWYRKYNWVGRAQAYDKFMSAGIQPIAELDARKDFVREIRDAANKFRVAAAKALDGAKDITVDNAIKLYKLGMDLEKQAEEIEAPALESKRDELKSGITRLLGSITAQLGGDARGSARGTIRATEKEVCFDIPLGSEDGSTQPVQEIPELPGKVCERSAGSDLVEQADPVVPPDPGL